MKITQASQIKYDYFVQCQDTNYLPRIIYQEGGLSAPDAFHLIQSYGKFPREGCCEPELLVRALNGKMQHGITVSAVAEDYVNRLVFASELKEWYPEWVRQDILGRARQIAQKKLGYVPTFVRTGEDFTTIPLEKIYADLLDVEKQYFL